MRRKKHKQTRRAISFYKINYGLHEPYKVLLDGNFIHACSTSNLGELDKHLTSLLGGRMQTYVTPCVMHELKSLGPEFKASVAAALKVKLHYCGHTRRNPDGSSAAQVSGQADAGEQPVEETDGKHGREARERKQGPVAAAECIMEQVGQSNKHHWWVASQDRQLRERLGKVAGTPIIFASVNGIHLETPSEMAKSDVKQVQEAGMALPQHERRSKALEDLEEIRPKLRTNVRFRKNKAKGPNPLAAKKKIRKPEHAPGVTAAAGTAAEVNSKMKRRRKRGRGADAKEGEAAE